MKAQRAIVLGVIGLAIFVLLPTLSRAAGWANEGAAANVRWLVQVVIGLAGLAALVYGVVRAVRGRSRT